MSNATYVLGTIEYLFLEIEATAPGFVWDPTEWTAEVALLELGTPLVPEPEGAPAEDDPTPTVWTDAVLETIDAVNYAKVLLGDDPELPEGRYRAIIRLTETSGGTEVPLLKAKGLVTIQGAEE